MRAVRQHWRPVAVIVAFAAVAVALGVYTLGQQRVQSPLTDRYRVRVTFAQTPGLTPGLGQPVTVAGVRVGRVTGTALVDGRSVVTLTILQDQLPHVYANAAAALRPNTALGDLEVSLRPGGAPARALTERDVLGVAASQVPVGPDGLLHALDADTRQYLAALLSAAGLGLDGRGPDLRRLFAAVGPTARQGRELAGALNARRRSVASVVSSLSALAVAAGGKDREIAQAVRGGAATLQAIAGEDAALRRSLRLLPATLATTRRALDAGGVLGATLTPALAALRPVTRGLPGTLAAADRLARTATPSLRRAVRPAVRAAVPVLEPLAPATAHLAAVTPDLHQSFKVLEYLGNELFWTDGGKRRGYAFWAAWAQHNGNSALSTGDAHGQVVRSALIFSCSGLNAVPQLAQLIGGVTALLPDACPTATEGR